ncbi:MAG TPA: hypothetical protein VJ486_02900 [Geothrix sp.]|nr:hypothetical protein [Geothrix sp.]
MNPIRLILTLSLVGISLQAAPPAAKAPAPRTATHKSKVPVAVTTMFSEGKATVTLRFEQPVTEARIGFRGLDGLVVNDSPVLEKTQYNRGDTLVLEVGITPGAGQSHLAVDIAGRFRGQRRMGVQTFSLGKPTSEQEKARSGDILTTSDGRRIKVMPVKPK